MKNKYHGSLSSNICNMKKLQVLILDGLTSGGGESYITYMEGKIPACVFNMTDLKKFHASGNGLIGPLADIHPDSKLKDLTLSHNQLTGFIPSSIQSHNFTSLQLDTNKFKGEFRPNPSISAKRGSSIKLNYNRLSGSLSTQFNYYDDADILVGNIWQWNQDNLPHSDKSSGDYDCGASFYHTSIIVWGVIVGRWDFV